MYKYTYTGEEPVIFPTLGIEKKKGDTVESDKPLYSPFLVEITSKTTDKKGE